MRYRLRTLMIVMTLGPPILAIAIIFWPWSLVPIFAGVPSGFLAAASWRYFRENSLPRWFAALMAVAIAVPAWALTALVLAFWFVPWGP
jgi:hypothetical protein